MKYKVIYLPAVGAEPKDTIVYADTPNVARHVLRFAYPNAIVTGVEEAADDA